MVQTLDQLSYRAAPLINMQLLKKIFCFSDLQVALSNNKLLLNADKSKFMLFSRSTNMKLDSLIISTNNGTNIERDI